LLPEGAGNLALGTWMLSGLPVRTTTVCAVEHQETPALRTGPFNSSIGSICQVHHAMTDFMGTVGTSSLCASGQAGVGLPHGAPAGRWLAGGRPRPVTEVVDQVGDRVDDP